MSIQGYNPYQLGAQGIPGQQGQQQGFNIRQFAEQFGSAELKKWLNEANPSDDELLQHVMQHPEHLQGQDGAGQYGNAAEGTATAGPDGTRSSTNATGDASAAAAAQDKAQIGDSDDSDSSSGDSYDENDKIPKDEAMASGQMCGMSDVSGADKCKPCAQQCLGETKAIKKVLETIQKADSDNSYIGGDISQVDQLIQNLSGKLKKGKKAADGNYSDPKNAESCMKECNEIVKKAVDIAGNNGVEIEVSEKRAGQLGVGGQQQGAGGGDDKAAAGKPGAGKQDAEANKQAKLQDETKQATEGNKKANEGDGPGGPEGQEQQKPFKIISPPQEVDKDIGLDEVKNNPQLAQVLESALDDTIAQQEAKGQSGQTGEPQAIDLGATREGSPLAQSFGNIGQAPGASGPVFGGGDAGVHQGPTAAYQPAAGKAGGVGGVGGVGGAGGPASQVNTAGLEAKMKKAGIDSNKKFKVKMQVYEPGQAVQVQRDGDSAPVKVGKNMGGATMKVKPPPLAGIDTNSGQIHKLGDIHATDGGKSGVFSAKIKEGAPIMNLQSAVNTVQGDVALPGTKTEEAKDGVAKEAKVA